MKASDDTRLKVSIKVVALFIQANHLTYACNDVWMRVWISANIFLIWYEYVKWGMETEKIFDINEMNTCQWCGEEWFGLVWFGCNVKHTTVSVSIKISKGKREKLHHTFSQCSKDVCVHSYWIVFNLFTRRFCTLQMYMLKIRRVNKVFEHSEAKFPFHRTTSCSILIEHAVLSCAFGAQKESHSYGLIIKVCYWVYLNRHYNQLTSHTFHLFPVV